MEGRKGQRPQAQRGKKCEGLVEPGLGGSGGPWEGVLALECWNDQEREPALSLGSGELSWSPGVTGLLLAGPPVRPEDLQGISIPSSESWKLVFGLLQVCLQSFLCLQSGSLFLL